MKNVLNPVYRQNVRWNCYPGAVEDHRALRVSGLCGRAGRLHLWSDEHRLLLPPEVILTEDKVGQVARQTVGLEDFHLRRGGGENTSQIMMNNKIVEELRWEPAMCVCRVGTCV